MDELEIVDQREFEFTAVHVVHEARVRPVLVRSGNYAFHRGDQVLRQTRLGHIARGAVLQRIRLSTQQPADGGDATVCDGRQEATARYRWRGKSVTFRNVTIAGEDCTSGDPLRFRCTTRTISGLGRTRDCTSANWRIITWGRYVPRVGGQYELSGPRAFPLIAVARSVR